jgi:hypothetical protein
VLAAEVLVLLAHQQVELIARQQVASQETVVLDQYSRRTEPHTLAAAVAATSTEQASLAQAELVAAVTASVGLCLLPATAPSILAVAAVADSTPLEMVEAAS